MQKRKVDLGITAMFAGLALCAAFCCWTTYRIGVRDGQMEAIAASKGWIGEAIDSSKDMSEEYGCTIPAWEWASLKERWIW